MLIASVIIVGRSSCAPSMANELIMERTAPSGQLRGIKFDLLTGDEIVCIYIFHALLISYLDFAGIYYSYSVALKSNLCVAPYC